MRLATMFRERRREARQPASGTARLLIGEEWTTTSLVNLSMGGAALRTEQRPELGSQVLVEIDQLGYFLCQVIRHLEGGIAIKFECATFPEEFEPTDADS